MPEISKTLCSVCRQPRASLKNGTLCGICQKLLCKECAQFFEPSTFSFLRSVPQELAHGSYCGTCYDEKVAPALEAYSEIMERAKDVDVFFKNERNLPLHRRPNQILSVGNCTDRKETLLRLAFFAAEQSCNGLVQVELIPKKTRDANGYQSTLWSGTGFPANILGKRDDE